MRHNRTFWILLLAALLMLVSASHAEEITSSAVILAVQPSASTEAPADGVPETETLPPLTAEEAPVATPVPTEAPYELPPFEEAASAEAPTESSEAAVQEEANEPLIEAGTLNETVPEEAGDPDRLLITLSGRIGLGETVNSRDKSNSLTVIGAAQPDTWLLEPMSEAFLRDDLTVGSLVTPLAELETEKGIPAGAIIAPVGAARFLQAGGVDAVCLTGGNMLDFGLEGYYSTVYTLKGTEVLPFGTLGSGVSHDADEVLIWQVKGVSIGMTGFAHEAGEQDLQIMLDRISLLRNHGCELVIVSLDWGTPNSTSPSAERIEMAKSLIDGGADAIWGHGPYQPQPICFYHGKPILFSCGTLVDGFSGAVSTVGISVQLSYRLESGTPVLKGLDVIPTKSGSRGVYQPVLMQLDKNRQSVFARISTAVSGEGIVPMPRGFNRVGSLVVAEDGSLQLPEDGE